MQYKNLSQLAWFENLPPDVSTNEMHHFCSQIGEVVIFRFMHDRQTGKQQTFGFCHFIDSSLVDSAVENLNNYSFKGYTIKVRRADQRTQSQTQSYSIHSSLNSNSNRNITSSNIGTNVENAKNMNQNKKKGVDEIRRVVNSFSTSEQREILSDMRDLIAKNEAATTNVLLEHPQLAQAILLIQIQFGLLEENDIRSLMEPVVNVENEEEEDVDIIDINDDEEEEENKNEKEKIEEKIESNDGMDVENVSENMSENVNVVNVNEMKEKERLLFMEYEKFTDIHKNAIIQALNYEESDVQSHNADVRSKLKLIRDKFLPIKNEILVVFKQNNDDK